MRNRGRQCGGRGCNRRMGQFLDPALLLLLKQAPAHGYTLLSRMAEFGLEFLAPTVIYRALREMEEQGWVNSTWDEEASQGPPRRIYALTALGQDVLRCCVAQLYDTRQVLEYFLMLYAELTEDDEPDALKVQPINEEAIMRLAIPAIGTDLDAPTSPVFGRCQTFILVNPETLEFEVLPNPAHDASGGAGVQSAQLVLQHGAEAVLARSLGPKAFSLIQSAGVPTYVLEGATVREAVRAFQAKRLIRL